MKSRIGDLNRQKANALRFSASEVISFCFCGDVSQCWRSHITSGALLLGSCGKGSILNDLSLNYSLIMKRRSHFPLEIIVRSKESFNWGCWVEKITSWVYLNLNILGTLSTLVKLLN